MQEIIEHIPIITTLFSIYFTYQIYNHYKIKKHKHLMWWTIGVVTFGLGTLSESINVLFGWNDINFRFWYIVGALLGGFPLAQGSVYLLMKPQFAKISSYIILSLVLIASISALLSPLIFPESFDYRLTGEVLEWQWIRMFSPIINIYAFIFLVGGAVYSAFQYYKKKNRQASFRGNIYIAIGGLLPGIGGTFTRMGYVEVLFITELIGLILIYIGYVIVKNDKQSLRKNK